MSDSWTLVIPRTPPSANVLLRYHWSQRQKLIDEWRNDIWALANMVHLEPMEKAAIGCTVYYKTRRTRDIPNVLLALDKLCADSLVRLGYLVDDSPDRLTWSIPVLDVDPLMPRTEVTLRPL